MAVCQHGWCSAFVHEINTRTGLEAFEHHQGFGQQFVVFHFLIVGDEGVNNDVGTGHGGFLGLGVARRC